MPPVSRGTGSYAAESRRPATRPRFALVLDVSMEADLAARHLRSIGLAATAGAALSAVLGVLIVRRQLRPLAAVTVEARRVSASNLDVDLPIAGLPGELRAFAEAFNDMLASLRASFARLTAFSADLAHELRTPLANMIGLAQVTLARSRTASEYREALESNVEELERLARMVADMLFLARMDQPAAPLRRERFDLAAEARHVAQYFEALLDDRRVSVEVSGRGEVSADRDMVRRALTNLLSNAIRHTPAGGRIEVSVRSAAGRVGLAVRNPGPGIPPEHLPRVFDRFYRLEPSRTGSGVGLGLALVKSIVLAHGGRIEAQSEPGLYTAFAFQIPASADAGKAEGGTRTRAAASDALRRG
ncbi:MAG: heavy metal sensor histidine kinase [Burkholderiales bacterium]|nr:heavy metal sensor histidine kinase [Burkholderiales bacterium]